MWKLRTGSPRRIRCGVPGYVWVQCLQAAAQAHAWAVTHPVHSTHTGSTCVVSTIAAAAWAAAAESCGQAPVEPQTAVVQPSICSRLSLTVPSVPPSSRCPVQGPGRQQPAAWAGLVGSWWAEVEAACGGGSGSAQEAVDAAVAGQAASAARLVVATCDLALKSRHAFGHVAPSQPAEAGCWAHFGLVHDRLCLVHNSMTAVSPPVAGLLCARALTTATVRVLSFEAGSGTAETTVLAGAVCTSSGLPMSVAVSCPVENATGSTDSLAPTGVVLAVKSRQAQSLAAMVGKTGL